ncbi:ABC transporter permease [Sporolactobacillus sp. THM19-2]|jgi:peptide/nickel transport system permease protein|uniref:ABC transporter permease n=1 Tax=Sporolactobacillus sp. THM19-2 TaxID=2511171 RepID=UPI00101FE3F9|nr:ABC transporter permease [Sporolactobacillus sp. THM19-2]RYL94473.1 ABC transporter permease [Sporolactobacillus sp. THM19-2]
MTTTGTIKSLKPFKPKPYKGQSFWKAAWKSITRKTSRMVGFIIIVMFTLMAIVGPYLYPPHLPSDPNAIYAPISWKYPLGTDFEGTSNLALIVTGARYVLLAAAFGALFTVLFGTVLGLISGYFIGWSDSIIMRITDFFLTVPTFPLLVVLSTVWNFGHPLAMGFILGITGWGGMCRAVRSQTLSLRERGFVEAARGLGLSSFYILFREILPNVSSYIGMNLLTSITGCIYAEVGLFFLGVVPFHVNNWGVMLNMAVFSAGAMSSPGALPYLLSPLLALLLLTLGIVLFLDAVDEMFNPRLREDA